MTNVSKLAFHKIVSAIFMTAAGLAHAQAGACSTENLSDTAWTVLPLGSGQTSTVSFSPNSNGTTVMEWQVDRKPQAANGLVRSSNLTALSKISFDVMSSGPDLLAICIEANDGAKFHAPISVSPGGWKRIVVTAADFKLSDDSPVKRSLDVGNLKRVLAFAELGAMLNLKGRNTIKIANVIVESEAESTRKQPSAGSPSGGARSDRGSADDVEFPCKDSRWLSTRAKFPAGRAAINPPDSTLVKSDDCVEWRYQRSAGSIDALWSDSVLTDFTSLSFDLTSRVDAPIVVSLEDRSGAKFTYLYHARAGQSHHISLQPKDFRPGDNNAVQSTLNPRFLAGGLTIADVSGAHNSIGANSIQLSHVRVSRGRAKKLLDLSKQIDGRSLSISENSSFDGTLTVRNGGTLKIEGCKFDLHGDLDIESGSTVIIDNATFCLRNRFNHDRTIRLGPGSRLLVNNTSYCGGFPSNLEMSSNARLELRKTKFYGAGFTAGIIPGATVIFDEVVNPGEFIVQTGGIFSLHKCDGVLIWIWCADKLKAPLIFPKDKSISSWSLRSLSSQPSGPDVSLKECQNISWALICDAGSDVRVDGSDLLAIGLKFVKQTNQRVDGIKNKAPVDKFRLPLTDRSLNFSACTVGAWNFYPSDASSFALSNSTFGEIITFDHSNATVTSSTCDGSGGYVGTKGGSILRLKSCILKCPVVALDSSEIYLDGCVVNGDLSASGKSRVHLVNTKVSGVVSQLEQSKIERR